MPQYSFGVYVFKKKIISKLIRVYYRNWKTQAEGFQNTLIPLSRELTLFNILVYILSGFFLFVYVHVLFLYRITFFTGSIFNAYYGSVSIYFKIRFFHIIYILYTWTLTDTHLYHPSLCLKYAIFKVYKNPLKHLYLLPSLKH